MDVINIIIVGMNVFESWFVFVFVFEGEGKCKVKHLPVGNMLLL